MSHNSRTLGRFQFRAPEQLEARAMLSGHSLVTQLAAALHGHQNSASTLLRQAAATSSVAGKAAKQSASQEVELSAALSDPNGTGTGTVCYESETEHGQTKTKFSVRVTGAAADATLDVAIDGTLVGQILTDASGNGSLLLSSNPKGPNQQPLPVDFPAPLAAGAVVTVDTLTGTLAAKDKGGKEHEEDHEENEVHLGAKLADPNSSATGKVHFESETEHGVAKTKFEVKVHGAAANATLDVDIDGVVIGQITTDAKGNGKLKLSSNPKGPKEQPLPANFPAALAAGSVVTVGGTLTGVLA